MRNCSPLTDVASNQIVERSSRTSRTAWTNQDRCSLHTSAQRQVGEAQALGDLLDLLGELVPMSEGERFTATPASPGEFWPCLIDTWSLKREPLCAFLPLGNLPPGMESYWGAPCPAGPALATRRHIPQRSAAVCTGASHSAKNSGVAAVTVIEQPAISSDVTYEPVR